MRGRKNGEHTHHLSSSHRDAPHITPYGNAGNIHPIGMTQRNPVWECGGRGQDHTPHTSPSHRDAPHVTPYSNEGRLSIKKFKKIVFVKINSINLQQFSVFFFKSLFLMMNLLIFNISLHKFYLASSTTKRTITRLPMKFM